VSAEVHGNIEIKARCVDLERARELVREAGAELAAIESQRDTYFRCGDGRLKLREIRSGSSHRAELIHYHRADAAGPRPSRYTLTKVRFPSLRRCWLALTRGTSVEVIKRREIWLLQGVRIHLDEVEQLGTFVELEAVIRHIGNVEEAERRCRSLAASLNIRDDDLIESSYSDLLALSRS
jgi:adenylate cyclase class 2